MKRSSLIGKQGGGLEEGVGKGSDRENFPKIKKIEEMRQSEKRTEGRR